MLVINANTKHPKEAWQLRQVHGLPRSLRHYYRTQFPAQTSLLNNVDFGAPMKGFAEQFEYARTWGPYASGPVPIGAMWNVTDGHSERRFPGSVRRTRRRRSCCRKSAS